MGYLETVLGYGENHLDFDKYCNILFKKVIINEAEEELCEVDLREALQSKKEVTLVLQDDVALEDAPEERLLALEDEDDLQLLLNSKFVSKEYGCVFTNSCCYAGICIKVLGVYAVGAECDIEQRIARAQEWISKLKQQDRLGWEPKLTMESNCCS